MIWVSKMATIVSCVNLKGGVGKTTLSVNLAAYFGSTGVRTLLVDLDPQTNATFSCMKVDEWEEHSRQNGTVADLLGARQYSNANASARQVRDVIVEDVFEGVDLIPSHLDLFTIDLDMAGATARETRLRRALQEVENDYDLIVCDCPPNLTIPTQNALAASSHFVVPISTDFLSALGVGILLRRIRQLSQDLDQKISLSGIVISRVGRPALHREEILAALKQQFPHDIVPSQLTERVKVAEAAAKQKSVFEMNAPDAAAEFTAVCRQIGKRIGVIP